MFFGNRKIDKQATAMINNIDYNISFSSAALNGIREAEDSGWMLSPGIKS